MQTHPDAELTQRLAQFLHARFQGATVPESCAVLCIDAIGTGVLGDHQQFPHASTHQALGLLHDIANGPTDQIPAHIGDDAKTAAMVAALRDLEIGIVAWCEFNALRRH